MKKLLFVLLLAVPLSAFAEKFVVHQDGQGRYYGYFKRSNGETALLLTNIPCPTPQYANERVASEYRFGERARRGCWKPDAQGQGGVQIHYTNGTNEHDWLSRYHYVDEVPVL
jgi:hypothetical protein